jgi:hypothetical protein
MKSEAPQENQKFHVAQLVSGLPARSEASSAPASKESDATPAPAVSPAQQSPSKTSAGSSAKCAKIEQDTDYQSGVGLTVTPGVHAAEDCCTACRQLSNCKAWTWGYFSADDEHKNACYMKSAAPTAQEKKHAPGLVSGLPGELHANEGIILSIDEQCGGKEWTGSGTCAKGLKCTAQNDWYSQCTGKHSAFTKVHLPQSTSAAEKEKKTNTFLLLTGGTTHL